MAHVLQYFKSKESSATTSSEAPPTSESCDPDAPSTSKSCDTEAPPTSESCDTEAPPTRRKRQREDDDNEVIYTDTVAINYDLS